MTAKHLARTCAREGRAQRELTITREARGARRVTPFSPTPPADAGGGFYRADGQEPPK
jgi:hypothetical protein